jgi:hypothetical protein
MAAAWGQRKTPPADRRGSVMDNGSGRALARCRIHLKAIPIDDLMRFFPVQVGVQMAFNQRVGGSKPPGLTKQHQILRNIFGDKTLAEIGKG